MMDEGKQKTEDRYLTFEIGSTSSLQVGFVLGLFGFEIGFNWVCFGFNWV
jgi:hypothetical protein